MPLLEENPVALARDLAKPHHAGLGLEFESGRRGGRGLGGRPLEGRPVVDPVGLELTHCRGVVDPRVTTLNDPTPLEVDTDVPGVDIRVVHKSVDDIVVVVDLEVIELQRCLRVLEVEIDAVRGDRCGPEESRREWVNAWVEVVHLVGRSQRLLGVDVESDEGESAPACIALLEDEGALHGSDVGRPEHVCLFVGRSICSGSCAVEIGDRDVSLEIEDQRRIAQSVLNIEPTEGIRCREVEMERSRLEWKLGAARDRRWSPSPGLGQ